MMSSKQPFRFSLKHPNAKLIPSLALSPTLPQDEHCLWSNWMEVCIVFQSCLHAIPVKGIRNEDRVCTFGFTQLYHVKLDNTGQCGPAGLSLPAEVFLSLKSALWRESDQVPRLPVFALDGYYCAL